jgi:Flp pilus assembly protein TadG
MMMSFRKDESGQALVENALTISFLLLFVLGSVEFGRLSFAAIAVSNSARAGAQYAAQTHATAADTPGIMAAAQNEYSYSPSALAVTVDPPVCTCSNNSNPAVTVACTYNSCSTGATLEMSLTVHTSTSFDPLIHLPGLPTTYTVPGSAVQKVLQ